MANPFDKFFDYLNSKQEPLWITPMKSTVVSLKYELSVVPEPKEASEPLARIKFLDGNDEPAVTMLMNVTALDAFIGKLISLRDLLEQAKK